MKKEKEKSEKCILRILLSTCLGVLRFRAMHHLVPHCHHAMRLEMRKERRSSSTCHVHAMHTTHHHIVLHHHSIGRKRRRRNRSTHHVHATQAKRTTTTHAHSHRRIMHHRHHLHHRHL